MSITKTAKSSTDIHYNRKNPAKKRRRKSYYSFEKKANTVTRARLHNSVTGEYVEIVIENQPVSFVASPVLGFLGPMWNSQKKLSVSGGAKVLQAVNPLIQKVASATNQVCASEEISPAHVLQEKSYTSQQRKKTIENLRKHQKTYEKKYGASDSQKREMSELYQEISRNWG